MSGSCRSPYPRELDEMKTTLTKEMGPSPEERLLWAIFGEKARNLITNRNKERVKSFLEQKKKEGVVPDNFPKYKFYAEAVGLSTKALKKYAPLEFLPKCRMCGEILSRSSVFCSEKCRKKWEYYDRTMAFVCVNCGKNFHPYRNWKASYHGKTQFCSNKCYFDYKHKKKIERSLMSSESG